MKRIWDWVFNRDLQKLDIQDPKQKQSVWMIRLMRRTNIFSILLFLIAILVKILAKWMF